MFKLIVFVITMLLAIAGACILLWRKVKEEKTKRIVLFVCSILTVLVHYSSILYHFIAEGDATTVIVHNPQYLLPIYPCNVVMWLCVIVALIKDSKSKIFITLTEFITFFGILSGVIGMSLNFDFIANPTFLDYDVTKGMFSHSLMILNCCLFPVFGYIRINTPRNILSVFIGVLLLWVIGLYNNLTFKLLTTYSLESINSMFLVCSPFAAAPWLTFYPIVVMMLILYFIFFNVYEIIAYKKGERWFNKIRQTTK